MENFSRENLSQELCIPVGTLEFIYVSNWLFDPNASSLVFEQVAGQHYFRIERGAPLELRFFHSSPGVGTRVATIDLAQVEQAEEVEIGISWEPSGIALFLRPRLDGAEGIVAKGVTSEKKFLVTAEGQVVQAGDAGVEVAGVRITAGGRQLLEPAAIEAWGETLKAVEILWNATSSDGYIYECVRTNLTISALVTGFEAYTKRRFTELEREGIPSNIDAVLTSLFSSRVTRHGLSSTREEFFSEGQDSGRTLLEQIAHEINFQNFDKCKKAFSKAYGVRFGEISDLIEPLRKFIRYRHRIVHVSPLLGSLATPGDAYGTTTPVFSNSATGQLARQTFTIFIDALHSATLQLRAPE